MLLSFEDPFEIFALPRLQLAKEVHLLNRYERREHIPLLGYAVDWGHFFFITQPFFYAIDWIYGIVGNFGVAILIFTVIVKTAFFPLAIKSYQSMGKMMAAARDAPPVPAMPAGNFGAPGHPRTREAHQANSRPFAAPAIITTAPTMEPPPNPPPKKKTKFPTFRRRLSFEPNIDSSPRKSSEHKRSAEHARPSLGGLMEARPSQEDPARLSVSRAREATPGNGHSNAGSQTALGGRLSDSSRSDASSNDHVQLATNKRPLLTSHSTIFRLPRRNKESNRKSLFPLA